MGVGKLPVGVEIFLTLVESSEVGELKSNDSRDLGDRTEAGSFCESFADPLNEEDKPKSMLCLDLGVIIDAGYTGLGRVVMGGGSLPGIGRLLLAFESKLSSRCLRRPFRMTYVPRPVVSGMCGISSSESE